ncbi:hypothetical protein AZ34_00400 [Hylemonella gracilis str. Niagara R]|uniref:Uncharacterized protein n=1 Tax=Hylemonella gracilis str. Niagara R TaxID=1458275 RepID=A0A016XLF7_9BURK|nr:hypothetical protein [Hylemonella gracilis]EYC52735.1 hypothetical protein AZ34_00400 [Hylemonella gracilis str. Niagara R]
MADPTAQALRVLAEAHLARVLKRIPTDRTERFILFVEIVRTMDYWGTHALTVIGDNEQIAQSFDLMYWGWNRAIAELFDPLEQPGAFLLMESTQQSREYATELMQNLGIVGLLRRLADLGDSGIMKIDREGNEFHFRMDAEAKAQFADSAEMDRFKAAEEHLSPSDSGWSMVSMQDALRYPDMPGNYLAREDTPAKRWLRPDLEELIKPLVKPWDTGRGVMLAYDARIEVDEHYMAAAMDMAGRWREAAGIHPKARLGTITGADIVAIGAALISLHAKHFACVTVGKRLFDRVSLPQSLTIWTSRAELEETISLMSHRTANVVHHAFDVLAMTSEQVKKLADHTTPLIPLLFDLGNGFVLRPVSCITRNPFVAIKTQRQWLDERTEHAVALDREEWMRGQLYRMFGGNRYACFPGSLKLRRAGSLLTDIDAVVYDRLTGDVGLFQLKWQDYSMNDVRQLRSKAANLSAELTDWANKLKSWIEENGVSALDQSLRLKKKRREAAKSIFLFAVSRAVVRTQGYGVKTNAPDLAMAVWPQFARVRAEVGPTERTLKDIHARLIQEYGQVPQIHPMPAVFRIGDATLYVHDFWNRTE